MIYDGTAPAEEHTNGPGPAETLWTCRAEGCYWVGTSDEAIDHVQAERHPGFDRVPAV